MCNEYFISILMDIKQLKKELGLNNKDLAEFYGMSYMAYANSTAKQRYELALCRLYEHILTGGKKNKTKNLIITEQNIEQKSRPLNMHVVGVNEAVVPKNFIGGHSSGQPWTELDGTVKGAKVVI